MPYVGKEPVRGQNRELDDISGSFNGGNTAFTMQVGGINTAAGSTNQVFINLGGVMQNPGTDFTVASSTITFTTAPANGLSFWGLIQGDAVDIQEPADGSVTNAKVASGAAIALDKLASTPAVLTGSTNNTITTVTAANAIQGEANLTFDGTTLNITDTELSEASDNFTINIQSGNNDFYVKSGGTTIAAFKGLNKHLEISDGDLVIGTAGHGIDFSANSHASGMTSELLDSYEEGTWTPDFFYHSSVSNVAGHYTKIGRMVYAYFTGTIYSAQSDQEYISNLPFTTINVSGGSGGVARGYQNFDIQDGPIYYIEENTTKVNFYKDNGVAMPASDLNGKTVRGMAVYTAAS